MKHNKEQKSDCGSVSKGIAKPLVSGSLPVIWELRPFFGIERFNCIEVSLKTTPDGGSYFTCLPISPLSYRKNKPTKAMVRVNKLKNGYTEFLINDDWGSEHQMLIPNYMNVEIEKAIKAAKNNRLLS
jgi:hypothetical protein